MYKQTQKYIAQKIAKRLGCSGTDYRTGVAGAGSWRGGRVKETGTDND